jgi:tRNA-dependent cyclodipeptide synthase
MRITQYLNTTEEDIQARRFNIFIGISLGNKYFTPKHIRDYLLWAIENTKEKVAILIPDKIHAVNYEVKSGYSSERALAVARRKGDEVEKEVVKIIDELKIPGSKIQIVRWGGIENESHLNMLTIFQDAFRDDAAFRKIIINITKETPHISDLDFSDVQYEKLSQYVIDELPMLIGGIQKDGVSYELLPYPGFANIDYLAIDLQEGKSFPGITKQLKIKNKLRFIEAYAE